MRNWSVIGSGVAGLCVATVLHEKGESIEVIEDPTVPSASYLAGGMLAPYCEQESASKEVVEQGINAIEWWDKHVSSVHKNGSLVLAPPRDAAELIRFAKMTEENEWVDPSDLEPDLKGHISKGLYFPKEAHLDPRLSLDELRQKLIASGVDFHTQKPSGNIIDCTGIRAAKNISNLRAVRGEMLNFECPDVNLKRAIRLLHPRALCYLVPRHNGQYMLGTTMVESYDTSPISARALIEMLSSAYAIHPAFAEARIIETGTGLRPAYPDNMPKIEYQEGCFFVNGMYRHGYLLAPYMANQLLNYISQESKS
ncbi:hypothetical protein COMNV_01323 [Commensalibacter sp. Nvir]|uniref:FAD-dependent oxidoreductase n=1 Tax=Commensalibacter sp. Nvir TaxID=3069817 RepID=UPI002D4C4975|nr:hypothetical protein COMNV_01323 [Commensalibacter sp. Nvir]